jgi:hypothetical protein
MQREKLHLYPFARSISSSQSKIYLATLVVADHMHPPGSDPASLRENESILTECARMNAEPRMQGTCEALLSL